MIEFILLAVYLLGVPMAWDRYGMWLAEEIVKDVDGEEMYVVNKKYHSAAVLAWPVTEVLNWGYMLKNKLGGTDANE